MILLNQNLGSLDTPPCNTEDIKIENIKLTEDRKDPLFYAIEIFFTPYMKFVDYICSTYNYIKNCIIFLFHH